MTTWFQDELCRWACLARIDKLSTRKHFVKKAVSSEILVATHSSMLETIGSIDRIDVGGFRPAKLASGVSRSEDCHGR